MKLTLKDVRLSGQAARPWLFHAMVEADRASHDAVQLIITNVSRKIARELFPLNAQATTDHDGAARQLVIDPDLAKRLGDPKTGRTHMVQCRITAMTQLERHARATIGLPPQQTEVHSLARAPSVVRVFVDAALLHGDNAGVAAVRAYIALILYDYLSDRGFALAPRPIFYRLSKWLERLLTQQEVKP